MKHIDIAILAAAVIAVPFVSEVASANFGSLGDPAGSDMNNVNLNGVWLTNNKFFYVGGVALQSDTEEAAEDAIANYDTIADFEATFWTVTPYCTDAAWDTCIYDYNYGDNGVHGWTACAGTVTGSEPDEVCSFAHVRINRYYDPIRYFTLERLVCHEVGHSAGLRHRSSGSTCMRQASSGVYVDTLDSHDRAHLEDEY